MIKYLLSAVVIVLLWHTRLSASQCTRTINNAVITFTCPSSISSQELNLYDLSVAQLDAITSIVAGGTGTQRGPFTSIPPNICLLRNLQTINLAFNRIALADPTGSLSDCLSSIVSLDLSKNFILQFPSYLIYHMPNVEYLYFQLNGLSEVPGNAFYNVSELDTINFSSNGLTTFELWALEVKTRADFSNNNIGTITNNYFFDTFVNEFSNATISLTNNAKTINFTDAVYEMYNQCQDVLVWLNGASNPNPPYFTRKLARIDFGTTQINCGCNQRDFLGTYQSSYALRDNTTYPDPIITATCAGDAQNVRNSLFINSSCSNPTFDLNSTVNFSQVYPRLCEINSFEGGPITPLPTFSAPTLNASTYPHYITAFMNPGACFFTFTNTTTVNIKCTNDTSNTQSTIPTSLLTSSYLANINSVSYPTLLSSFPSYLCALPSKQIDLSYQAFTTLTDATFPCLDSFTKISLAHNQITSVSMSSGNFQNLASLDLSSNMLTSLPYSILRPTPTSLRYLDLRNNSITSIDLFVYTLKNITVNLDNNPINSSSIINPTNATLVGNGTSSVNITLPSSVTNTTTIVQDSTVASLLPCGASFSLIQSALSNLQRTANVVLLCTCKSYGLIQLYIANGANILATFTCSNTADAQSFSNLTNVTCSSEPLIQIVPCPVTTTTTTQISTDMTTMNSLNTSIEYTSTSFTIITTNSSSPSTLNTSDQTQGTTSSGSTILPSNATSSDSTTLSNGTTLSNNETSSESTTPAGGTTSSGGTTVSNNGTSSGGTTPSGGTTVLNNGTSSGGTTPSGSTVLPGNGTSSGSSTPSGGTTLTGNSTSSGGSVTSSTGVTSPPSTPLQSGAPLQSSATNGSSSTNVGLIVGLTVGLGLPFLIFLIILLILLILYLIGKKRGRPKKSVKRAAAVGQVRGDNLSARVQPRNLRAVRLAPIPTASTSALPDVPVKVLPSAANSSLLNPNSNLRAPGKGIPIRMDPISSPSDVAPQYPPNSNALNNSSSFRPINLSTSSAAPLQQPSEPPKPRKPRALPLLNIGGNIRH